MVASRLDQAQGATAPEEWRQEADVVIAGFGGAGAAAAIEAHDAGANVLILEKAPAHLPGGNTGCCMGFILPPSNAEDGRAYYRALGSGTVKDEELILTFVSEMMGISDWLAELGISIEVVARNRPGAFPSLPGSKVDQLRVPGGGAAAFRNLLRHVNDRKIRVLYETPARRLIQNRATREVIGVVAEREGQPLPIKSRRAVVLACGGYENNSEMTSNYNFPGLRFHPYGTPYNTGDGITMASAVGAKLWHMFSLQIMDYTVKAAAQELGCSIPLSIPAGGGSFIYVNKYGRRFANEKKRLGHYKGPVEPTFFDPRKAEYANIPFYMVFDESLRSQGPLVSKRMLPDTSVGWAFVHGLFEGWSEDNRQEIEKGWIVRADDPGELAAKIGVDSAGLADTIRLYNESATTGKDPQFDRPAKTMQPIQTPPYYAVELGLCIINTQGGPVRDARARVLDVDEQAVPRLYVAGELGSFFGHLYQGGSNFPEALAFGRIAGKNAAALAPWG